MCGIVGYIGSKDIAAVILIGLERLEYRGYDSCGIAAIDGGGQSMTPPQLKVRKTVGRLQQLKDLLIAEPVSGSVGIGHTRWATHGVVVPQNAHPFVDCTGSIAMVHNGIIENYEEILQKLQKKGHKLQSDTDTEVVVHLIEQCYYAQPAKKRSLADATLAAVRQLKGSFSLALISKDEPEILVGVRRGSPLVVGLGDYENVLASDMLAMVGIAKNVLSMEDKEVCIVRREGVELRDFDGKVISREPLPFQLKVKAISKGKYRHFMRKEIYEQPAVIAHNLETRLQNGDIILGSDLRFYPEELNRFNQIVIQACGTSYHAGLVGRQYFEKFCRIPTHVEISSELRTHDFLYDDKTLMLSVSQSGETADTLAALRKAAEGGIRTLSLVNVKRSSIDRESDSVVHLHAGPEIGVASTKAYTAQIFNLLALALYMGRHRGTVSESVFQTMRAELKKLPLLMNRVLQLDAKIRAVATRLSFAHDFIFLGRGINYPTALEGALKLKEISYINATGYPAGEMKHGPISLITENVPVICIALRDSVYEKMISNIAEAKARKGRIIIIGTEGDKRLAKLGEHVFYVPRTSEHLSPMLSVLPLQQLAYHVAVLRGNDVDRPRNLAKSVTVE
jgi:glucosamine--fructose-6-phosphate aminotransferase (isomerizing)